MSYKAKNEQMLNWVEEVADLCEPDGFHWCDGSQEEYEALCSRLVESGTFRKLPQEKRPNSYLAWSDPSNIAHVATHTFSCTLHCGDAGPPNMSVHRKEMKKTLQELFGGCMQERMYAPYFTIRPLDQLLAKIGLERSVVNLTAESEEDDLIRSPALTEYRWRTGAGCRDLGIISGWR